MGNTRRKIQDEDIIEFCESSLGFECRLIIDVITQFLSEDFMEGDNTNEKLLVFHKALKYGIPDALGISCYEYGFADRMLAQVLRDALLSDGYTGQSYPFAMTPHRENWQRLF